MYVLNLPKISIFFVHPIFKWESIQIELTELSTLSKKKQN